jgi:hypothetical protein
MILGGVVEILFGINAEGKSLEAVTKPLTSVDSTDQADSLAIPPAGAPA